MLIFVKIFGIFVIGIGIVYLLNPKIFKPFVNFWIQGNRLYIAGVLRLLIGAIILLSASSQCRWAGVVIGVGILILAGGIIIFILGLAKMKSIISWLNNRPLLILRLIGLITLAVGALLIYSV